MKNRTLLILLTIIITIVVLISAIVYSSRFRKNLRDNLVGEFSRQELTVAAQVALVLEKEVSEIQEELSLMGQLPEIKNGDSMSCSYKLRDFYNTMDLKPGNLGRMDKDGIFYCGVLDSIIGVNATRYAYIKEILETHNPVLSRGLLFEYTDHSEYLTALHVPIFDEGNYGFPDRSGFRFTVL